MVDIVSMEWNNLVHIEGTTMFIIWIFGYYLYIYTRGIAHYACFIFGEGRKRGERTNAQRIKIVTDGHTQMESCFLR